MIKFHIPTEHHKVSSLEIYKIKSKTPLYEFIVILDKKKKIIYKWPLKKYINLYRRHKTLFDVYIDMNQDNNDFSYVNIDIKQERK